MAATKLNTIKNRIKYTLESLAREGILAEVQVDDLKTSIFDREFAHYPVAILTTPAITNEAITNVQNFRTYDFEIMVLQKADNVKDPTEIEDLIENILNRFDNDPTLKGDQATGAADGAVDPAASAPAAVVSRGKTYIGFSITIRAKAVRDLTFI